MKFSRNVFLAFAATVTAVLVACGDDGSGSVVTEERTEVVRDTVTITEIDSIGFFNSVKELPECSDSLAGVYYRVKDDHYSCFDSSWKKIENFVQGVCNIQECTDKNEGKFVYSKLGRKMYQCAGGKWLDQEANGFTESDFVSCYLEALLQADVEAKSDLPKCTEESAHGISRVSDSLYVCLAKKWSKLADEVVSVGDLPSCKKDSSMVFVLGKLKAYVCKDGQWYCDGKSISQSSSSSIKIEFSSSSTTKIELDSAALNDTIKVRGICMPSVTQGEKNEEVTWKFINLGGNVYTMSWILGDVEAIFRGDDVEYSFSEKFAPKISYETMGVKKATLIVNNGLKSQSDDIACASLNITPTPVTGCQCVANKSGSMNVTEEKPDSVTWKVSGCAGGEGFTYRWSIGGLGESKKVVEYNSATYSPTISVSNSDGAVMNVSCPAVSFVGKMGAQCSLEQDGLGWYFSAKAVVNVNGSFYGNIVGSDGYSSRENVETDSYYQRYNRWLVKEFEEPVVESSSSEEEEESSSSEVEEESSSSEPEEESSSSEVEEESSSSEVEEESSSSEPEEESSSSSEDEEESSSSEDEEESSSSESEEESSSSFEVEEESSSSSEPEEESSSSEEEVESSSSEKEGFDEYDGPFGMPRMSRLPLLSDVESQVFTYTLTYGKDTLCQASTVSCAPDFSVVQKGESVSWRIQSITGFVPKSYKWTFSDGSTSTSAFPKTSFSKAGSVKAKVLLDKGLKTETTIQCSSLNVERSAIVGCFCGAPELKSASDDLANGLVSYQWSVGGCMSVDGGKLTYEWNDFKPVSETSVKGTFMTKGSYAPSVTVSNEDGTRLRVSCKEVFVNDSKAPIQRIEYRNGMILEPGEYLIENCDGRVPTRVFPESTVPCEDLFVNGYEYFSYFDMNRNACYGSMDNPVMPMHIKVPNGATLRIGSCF